MFSSATLFPRLTATELEALQAKMDFSSITIEKIKANVETITKIYTEAYDAIAAQSISHLSFASVFQPIINADVITGNLYGMCTFPMHVHVDEAVREASTEAAETLEKMMIECAQRRDVFLVMQKYEQGTYQWEKVLLDKEERQYVEETMLDYKRSGMFLASEADRDRVAVIKKEIAELATQFEHHYNESKDSFLATLEELDGVEQDWFTAERKVDDQHYKVTSKFVDMIAVSTYAKNPETRRKMYHLYNAQCMDDNLPILKKILELRQELAQLLGYASAADYALEERMAGDAKTVQTFLDDMNKRFTPLLEKNLRDLTQFARDREGDPTLELAFGDMRYYSRLREEMMCDLNMENIKKYFPLSKVMQGTFEIYEHLLGLKFVRVESNTIWHPDVMLFDTYQVDPESGELREKLGCFYMDLHPREGKYNHQAAFDLVANVDVTHLTGKARERRTGINAMVCNFPKNVNLPFDDVVTFFHEFGHVMHFICSKTKLSQFSSGKTETDFVEAPSQMLENWCFEASALAKISCHVETGEPLSADDAKKLADKEKLHAGFFYKRQLMLANFDFLLHVMPLDQVKALDLVQFAHQVQQDILQMPPVPGTCMLASFSHLVGGYDAGYYGYMMSETYAQDMFASVFKRDPLSAESGRHYRECILAPGASMGGMDMIKKFLGREPRLDAFLEKCGLPQPQRKRLLEDVLAPVEGEEHQQHEGAEASAKRHHAAFRR